MLLLVFGLTVFAASRMQIATVTNWWDADEYFRMAEQFAAGQAPTRAAPYVYRLATPWLVATFWPEELVAGYLAVNLAATAATIVLMAVWLRRFVATRWARLIPITLFVIEWHGPARFVFYYPVYVDPLVYPFLVGGLILADMLHVDWTPRVVTWLAVLCLVGAFAREVVLVIPLALLVGRLWPHTLMRVPLRWLALPFAGAIVGLTLTRLLTVPRVVEFSFP